VFSFLFTYPNCLSTFFLFSTENLICSKAYYYRQKKGSLKWQLAPHPTTVGLSLALTYGGLGNEIAGTSDRENKRFQEW